MLLFHIQCAHFCSEWSILGCGTGAFWDMWIRSIVITDNCPVSLKEPWNTWVKLACIKLQQTQQRANHTHNSNCAWIQSIHCSTLSKPSSRMHEKLSGLLGSLNFHKKNYFSIYSYWNITSLETIFISPNGNLLPPAYQRVSGFCKSQDLIQTIYINSSPPPPPQCPIYVSMNWINIDGTKPLSGPMLTYH